MPADHSQHNDRHDEPHSNWPGQRFTLPVDSDGRTGDLRILARDWDVLLNHLLGDGDEHAALLLCGLRETDQNVTFLVRDQMLLGPADYLDRGALHLSVAPTTLARAAKRARLADAAVVLVHSHPFGGRVAASQIDLRTEADLCRRVLTARTGKPAAALVVGPDGVDARAWNENGATAFESIRVLGDTITRISTSSTGLPGAGKPQTALRRLEPESPIRSNSPTARQELLWGADGQAALRRSKVVVVGAGGTGSHVATQLAHLRVEHLTLIDHDVVETSNLSRIIGLGPEDVGRTKVDALVARLQRINPDIHVEATAASVLDVNPLVLTDADVIICATDGHGSRSFLTELGNQYYVPVVDLGVEVVPGDHFRAGGGVRVLRPGTGCLWCAQNLTPDLVREEYLTEDERRVEAARGYLRGHHEPAPSVVALNGVVASLAVMEVCQLLVGMLGSGRDRLLYRSEKRALSTTALRSNAECHVCGSHGVLGKGDAARTKTRWRKHPARGA